MTLAHRDIEVLDEVVALILKEKTPAERIRIGFDIWTSAEKMLTYHLKAFHPDWDNPRISREVARRLSHGAV